MAILGRTNRIRINRFVDFGAYLDGGDLGEILLPTRWVPEGAAAGALIEAFVYRDSEDRLIATTDAPLAEVDDCAFLEVIAVNSVGAFMNWGLEKDLFVPFGEQRRKMKVGSRYVVILYVDNTGRIAASSKLRKFLPSTSTDYQIGDEVEILVSTRTDLGFEAVIEDDVLGMVFESDALDQLTIGMRTMAHIKGVRPDGKVNLAMQAPLATRADLSDQILAALKEAGGSLSLTDKSPPDEIFAAFGVSKRAYKQALGALYKARRIVIEQGKITMS